MNHTKISLILIGFVACLSVAQAAGGIKGGASSQNFGIKSGLRPPQPPQAFIPIPQPPVARQPFRPAPQPLPQIPIFEFPRPQPPVKGPAPTQAGPIFTPILTPVFEAKRPQTPVFTIQQEPLPAPVQPAPVQVVQVQEQVQEQVSDSEPDAQTQQQQEIDPNAAAQDSSAAVVGPPRAAGPASTEESEANPRPEPYSFQYSFDAGDAATSGSSQRSETQDASGKVTGFYTLRGEDGRDRRVDYIADASGFRAVISTNEMGTAPKDSADVDWNANAPSDAQIRVAESATQLARSRAPTAPVNQIPAGSFQQLTKVSSPRKNAAAAAAAASQQQQIKIQQAAETVATAQLLEPFEQIRQSEFNTRARKSRHAPFYLFTV